MIIRKAQAADCKALLTLMQQLAVFEGYIDDFCVTKADLLRRGFPTNGPAEFGALIAEDAVSDKDQANRICGMVVYYLIPFTYTLKPTFLIKEVFVQSDVRSQGVGQQLFDAARKEAKNLGCGCMKWTVLTDNLAAQRFYQRQGARHDAEWQGYVLDL